MGSYSMDDDGTIKGGIRDYNLAGPIPVEPPTWVAHPEGILCPNCEAHLCFVQVRVRYGEGFGTCSYHGCPACKYASPSSTTPEITDEDVSPTDDLVDGGLDGDHG